MSNETFDNKFFIRAICILFIMCFITLILTFADYGRVVKENKTLQEKDTLAALDVDYKLVQEIMDTIEGYYLVNKLDTKQIKIIKLNKCKIDTIKINHGNIH